MIRPCLEFEPLVEALLADELDHDGRGRLLAHAMACGGCRSFVDLHHELLDVDADDGLPEPESFAAMRSRVLAATRLARAAPATVPRRRRAAPGGGVRRTVMAAAAAVALVAAGFLAGWNGRAARPVPLTLADGDVRPALVDRRGDPLAPAAVGDDGLEALARSPYRYSSVSVGESDDGRLDLAFDVSRRITMRGSPDDPLVRDVLLSTLLDPAPLGARLQAASLAARSLDPIVKEALIAALAEDPNQAVRGRCLELLAPVAEDPEVQQAIVGVLRGDEAVHLRLQAIDLLAASDAGRARLDRAMEELDEPEDRALVARASHRLR